VGEVRRCSLLIIKEEGQLLTEMAKRTSFMRDAIGVFFDGDNWNGRKTLRRVTT
jgi:hypothetical protein